MSVAIGYRKYTITMHRRAQLHIQKIRSYTEVDFCCHANTTTLEAVSFTSFLLHSFLHSTTCINPLTHLHKPPHSPSIASCLNIGGVYPPHSLGSIFVLVCTRPGEGLQVRLRQCDAHNDVQLSVVQEDLRGNT